jgi:ABC-type Fe3+/spermidine/putrescine transport system ATPase subunit
MRLELRLLQRRLGVTVLFVTHDQIEALSLSDRIAVMQAGRVEQVGPPRSLYEAPASAFVRDFLGSTVVLGGRVTAVEGGAVRVALDGGLDGRAVTGRSVAPAPLGPGAAVHVAIRPEDVQVDGGGGDTLPGVIETLLFGGDRYEARVALGGAQRIVLLLPRTREWKEGQGISLGFPPEAVSVWPA